MRRTAPLRWIEEAEARQVRLYDAEAKPAAAESLSGPGFPLTTKLTTDSAAVAPLEIRYAELQGKFDTMHTVFQQQLVAPEMFRVQTELKTATDRVAADTQAIDDLKEQGRKADALPGWFC